MRRSELYAIFDRINHLLKNGELSSKHKYALAKNKRILQPEIEILNELEKPPTEFQEFNDRRIQLCIDMAKKDENGEAIFKISNNNKTYDIEDVALFKLKFDELKEECKDVIENYRKQQASFIELLNQEINIDLVKINLTEWPESIHDDSIDILYEMFDL